MLIALMIVLDLTLTPRFCDVSNWIRSMCNEKEKKRKKGKSANAQWFVTIPLMQIEKKK